MSGCAAASLDDVANIDWRPGTDNHRDVTHEEARRYYAHFSQREWARLANPADGLLEFTSGMHSAAAPALLRRLQARQIDLATAIVAVTLARKFDGAAAEATRWTEKEPAGWHHGQQLFGETARLRCGIYARILDVDDACRDLHLGGNLGEQMAFGPLLRERQREYDTVHDSLESRGATFHTDHLHEVRQVL